MELSKLVWHLHCTIRFSALLLIAAHSVPPTVIPNIVDICWCGKTWTQEIIILRESSLRVLRSVKRLLLYLTLPTTYTVTFNTIVKSKS